MVKGDEIIMFKAENILTTLINAKDEYAKEMDKLSKLQSKYDREINMIYHDLERKTFNAAEGYFISKKLQDALRKRRIVKQEMYALRMINDTVKLQGMTNNLSQAKGKLNKINKDNMDSYTNDWNLDVDDLEKDLIAQ